MAGPRAQPHRGVVAYRWFEWVGIRMLCTLGPCRPRRTRHPSPCPRAPHPAHPARPPPLPPYPAVLVQQSPGRSAVLPRLAAGDAPAALANAPTALLLRRHDAHAVSPQSRLCRVRRRRHRFENIRVVSRPVAALARLHLIDLISHGTIYDDGAGPISPSRADPDHLGLP